MDHCLQQISSEVPIVLPVMLRGKLSPLRCRAKGFPGSGTLRREEKLSKDTARAQHKPGWAAGESSEVKGVRDRETNNSEGKKCPRKGATEVLEEQVGEEDTGTPRAQLRPG